MTVATARADDDPKPVHVRVDELAVQLDREEVVTFREVPIVFDTAGQSCIVLLDARAFGGPVLSLGLASTTAYAFAMAVMQMRARLRRAAKSTSPTHPPL
jgi:hypothetical protein